MRRFGRFAPLLAVVATFGCSEASVYPPPGTGGAAAASGGGAGGSSGVSGGGAGGVAGHAGTSGGVAGSAGSGGMSAAAGTSGAAGTASGAGTAGAGGVPLGPTFASVADIMRQNCGAPSCHGGGPEGQDVVFVDTTTLYDTLMSKVVMECGGTTLVKPGDPLNSALLRLPTWQCGDLVMPKGCIDDPCLTAPEMDAIRGWITAGAPR